jgi:hypothetical protein
VIVSPSVKVPTAPEMAIDSSAVTFSMPASAIRAQTGICVRGVAWGRTTQEAPARNSRRPGMTGLEEEVSWISCVSTASTTHSGRSPFRILTRTSAAARVTGVPGVVSTFKAI